MSNSPPCPKRDSEYTYEDGNMFVCLECAHEWPKEAVAEAGEEGLAVKYDEKHQASRTQKTSGPSGDRDVGIG